MTVAQFRCFSSLAFVLAAMLPVSSALAEDDSPQLRIHRTQAVDVDRVGQLAAAVVTPQRAVRIPGLQEVAVFATSSEHETIEKQIQAFEAKAILIQRIDIKTADLSEIRRAVERQQGNRVQCDYDRVRRQVLILGRKDDLASAANLIQGIVKNQPPIQAPTPRPASPPPTQRPVEPIATLPPDAIRAPVGPVRIVHIKELDLFLIRAGRGQLEHGIPAPKGNVHVHD